MDLFQKRDIFYIPIAVWLHALCAHPFWMSFSCIQISYCFQCLQWGCILSESKNSKDRLWYWGQNIFSLYWRFNHLLLLYHFSLTVIITFIFTGIWSRLGTKEIMRSRPLNGFHVWEVWALDHHISVIRKLLSWPHCQSRTLSILCSSRDSLGFQIEFVCI